MSTTLLRPTTGRSGEELAAVVAAAGQGDPHAWEQLVVTFGDLIASIARSHRLGYHDQQEVAQRVWCRLLLNIAAVRDPEALGGWLATTARRECLKLLGELRRQVPTDQDLFAGEADRSAPTLEDALLQRERRETVRDAVAGLPGRQRLLFELALNRPALDYEQISAGFGIPIGSIGPTRGRGLERLRSDPRLVSLMAA